MNASARSAGYALFSRLLTSPYERELGVWLPDDTAEAIAAIGSELPYTFDFGRLCEAVRDHGGAERLRRAYGMLFDVGADGPPVPLREALVSEHSDGKEEVVRFYDYFDYRLRGPWSWAPDHAAVELEFMHYLTYLESEAQVPEALCRAQRDFLTRHVTLLMRAAVVRLRAVEAHPYFRALIETTASWTARDLTWLSQEM